MKDVARGLPDSQQVVWRSVRLSPLEKGSEMQTFVRHWAAHPQRSEVNGWVTLGGGGFIWWALFGALNTVRKPVSPGQDRGLDYKIKHTFYTSVSIFYIQRDVGR